MSVIPYGIVYHSLLVFFFLKNKNIWLFCDIVAVVKMPSKDSIMLVTAQSKKKGM